ncbi:hypothetical protein LTR37_021101 [Vermiconidia calcicola]|uniref:Uncharacterized protein n=1 Tax=Vermiconidia calcicola TaxID=1690605 RepID=A0ACC3M9M0_9PEZI|nr:hypothetical protein LTR37_021101 [Vermiconidia calcicola]
MADESPSEPFFRSNKKRKVIRRRADSEDGNEEGLSGIVKDASSTEQMLEDGNGAPAAVRLQRKGIRKHGIGFNSTESRRTPPQEQSDETALVLANSEDAEQVAHSDRFVRPTGKVVVTDDKHMMAYIDTKLAEIRSSASSPMDHGSSHSNNMAANAAQGDMDRAAGVGALPTEEPNKHTVPATVQQAQARSGRQYQRPTKRRQTPQRGQVDVARDSIIDQIMQESQVPLYERSASNTPAAAGDAVDNDAATAEAFKAQLLAEMEEQYRRRPPPSTEKSKDAKTSYGPKLGGSRSQREKMRAIEEAKSGSTKK